MAKVSAGLLVFRQRAKGELELLLVHPGGPLWAKRDSGAWSIPKGLPERGEALLDAARREAQEETGFAFEGPFRMLPPVRQAGGKLVHAWLVEGDADVTALASNCFQMEWPPRSGKRREFPEIDRAEWFRLAEARRKILPGQAPLLDAAEALICGERRPETSDQAISRRSGEGSSRAR
ncbi:NUDIX domain-containing protein [Geminicoccaceae bacterium 1502E]|nr:NUDIX domain-containing protein [Geminicoccaceae bacterium 1502E]